jgi:hypothetical protein
MSGDRELGRIVASHMVTADEGSDVANSRHLDPERPPLVVIQELEHRELHPEEDAFQVPVDDASAKYTGPCVACGSPVGEPHTGLCPRRNLAEGEVLTGAHVFDTVKTGPWDDRPGAINYVDPRRPVDEQLREIEAAARTRRLAQEALARMDAHLPPGASDRKGIPIATGFIDYFPDAVAAVAQLSRIGNDQHNPGTPLHWDRAKSGDESDCLMRHFLERGTFDNDGVRHSVKVAWRAMAQLQKEIEAAKGRLEPIFKDPS